MLIEQSGPCKSGVKKKLVPSLYADEGGLNSSKRSWVFGCLASASQNTACLSPLERNAEIAQSALLPGHHL
ncbi:hypothetical protein Nepgr_010516 [Nepenthes gracilis]|uniref:Uncharacterized protein n=1 Tax=Nepenthes gracilis TaxID=150966 RepID=A0AAD3SDC1_NEPGR|nr:hypothetical protein Nepgr_010516 [Nepenthes gracilis]